jgi:probable O-glycosylation ligase (exosortase A-associated)
MLRLIFVFMIIALGSFASIFSPFYALLFYLWNAYFRPDDWTYGGLIASLNLSFLIGGYLVLATAFSRPRLRVGVRIGLLALFFADTLFSTIQSEHFAWSWAAWIEFSKVLTVSYVIILLTKDRTRFRYVLLIIAVALGFECAKQGWAQLYRAPGAQNNNPIPFLGDNNGVAVGTMMLVPILNALAQTASGRWEAFAHRFVLIGVFLRGITTYSRGGFLAAAVLGIFSLARSRKKVRAFVGAGVIAAIVLTVMPQEFWDKMNTIDASESERDDSAAGRLHFWVIARDMAVAKPFTGIGFSAYNLSYETYNRPTQYGEFGGARSVHSIWFGPLAELGYPGFVLFVALFASSVWSLWSISRKVRRDPERHDIHIYANALLTSLVTFGVGGTFLPLQYNEMFWHFMALGMTLTFLAQEQPNEATATVKARQSVPAPLQPAFLNATRSTMPK